MKSERRRWSEWERNAGGGGAGPRELVLCQNPFTALSQSSETPIQRRQTVVPLGGGGGFLYELYGLAKRMPYKFFPIGHYNCTQKQQNWELLCFRPSGCLFFRAIVPDFCPRRDAKSRHTPGHVVGLLKSPPRRQTRQTNGAHSIRFPPLLPSFSPSAAWSPLSAFLLTRGV